MGNDLLSIADRMPAFAACHLSQDERREIERAVERGSAAYIASRLAKIPAFDGRYFSFRGAFALHRKTWAKDVYKTPSTCSGACPPSWPKPPGLAWKNSVRNGSARRWARSPPA